MKNWIKLALRNILRNKRRSVVTILAVGVGYAAVSLFCGYIDGMYYGLRSMAIKGEGLGHLTVFKAGWNEKGKLDPERYLFSKEDIQGISALIKSEGGVVLASPQLQMTGLVSNGVTSTIFIAQGLIPEDDRIIKGEWAQFRPVTGKSIDSGTVYGVEMAKDLAKYLNLSAGKGAVVMSTTLGGQMNAMDIEVRGVYDTTLEATNDKMIRFTLPFAQSLYDTQSAERIVVLLDDWEKTELMRNTLLIKLEKAGYQCQIRTWNELSLFYSKAKGMFDVMFIFLFSIVLVIVVMSMVNTMGMTVLERTREIGTLRALGLKRRGVSMLFALEGGLLGSFGCILGLVLHTMVWTLIKICKPSYLPPNISEPVPLQVHFVPQTLLVLVGCIILLSLTASIIPARRAAWQNVVEALGHT